MKERDEVINEEEEIKLIQDLVRAFYRKEIHNIIKLVSDYKKEDHTWRGGYYYSPSEIVDSRLNSFNRVLENIFNIAEYNEMRRDLSKDLSLAKIREWSIEHAKSPEEKVSLEIGHSDNHYGINIKLKLSKDDIEKFIYEYCDKRGWEINELKK